MQIKRLARYNWLAAALSTEGKVFPKFAGIRVANEEQLMDLIATLISDAHYVEELHDDDQEEAADWIDDSIWEVVEDELDPEDYRDLLDSGLVVQVKHFAEFSKKNRRKPKAIWTVMVDCHEGPRKEQVSLTLNSTTLRRLRQEAKQSKRSLSAVIDRNLSTALETPDAETLQQLDSALKQTLAEFERCLEAANQRYSALTMKRAPLG